MKNEFLREIKKRSLSVLARKSGVPESTLRSWLKYGVEPTLANAEKVAEAMGKEIVMVKRRTKENGER